MAIDVKENEDGSITIIWDENDEREKIFNDWGEDEFVKALTSGILSVANRYIEEEETLPPETIVETSETQSKEESEGTVEEANGED